MDFDLSSRRLEKDQLRRKEEAKRKLYQEKKLHDEQLAREQKMKEEAYYRKLEEENREEERLAQEAVEMQESGGIRVSASHLVPYVIDGADDKVILPESMLNELIAQDASSRGPMYFKITSSVKLRSPSSASQIITHTSHCGVREFTAEVSHIGLPRKVFDSLIPSDEYDILDVSIKYVRLPKCSYVKLQPKANDFFSVGPVKMCLEENLRLHSTLTLGDVLTVWYRGKAHVLKVVDMKPESRGSLVDSDVEVDLDLSEEYLQSNPPLQPSAIIAPPTSSTSTISDTPAAKYHRLDESKEMSSPVAIASQSSQQASYDLPIEPDPKDNHTIAIKVKTPNTGTLSRRFLASNDVSSLFHYVSQATNKDVRQLQLSTRFPPRQLKYHDVAQAENTMTYETLGISSQETFMAQFL